tara:strand:+ start:672 stop:839 length:168 start_codon:yes stop_codon:yes gene_type:complete
MQLTNKEIKYIIDGLISRQQSYFHPEVGYIDEKYKEVIELRKRFEKIRSHNDNSK